MGWGTSVISQLLKTKIKRNIYYEIKDKVVEERTQGPHIQKMTRKVKCYGTDETKQTRDLLMEILRDRMTNHKGKFISPIIYEELCTLEVKKNGRIEHSATAHDDQIFSYLMALYVWYEGKDLMERFGLQKGSISTDDDNTMEFGVGDDFEDIGVDLSDDDSNTIYNDQKEFFKSSKTISFDQWRDKQNEDNLKADEMLRRNPRTRRSWYEHNHLQDSGEASLYTIPNEIFNSFYFEEKKPNKLKEEFDSITDLR